MRPERVHLIACVAALGFIAAYAAPLVGIRLELWYLPLERRWVLGAPPPGIGMEWYGRTLVAVAVSALGGGLAALLGTRGGPPSRAWPVALALAVSGALAAYAMTLWGRPLG